MWCVTALVWPVTSGLQVWNTCNTHMSPPSGSVLPQAELVFRQHGWRGRQRQSAAMLQGQLQSQLHVQTHTHRNMQYTPTAQSPSGIEDRTRSLDHPGVSVTGLTTVQLLEAEMHFLSSHHWQPWVLAVQLVQSVKRTHCSSALSAAEHTQGKADVHCVSVRSRGRSFSLTLLLDSDNQQLLCSSATRGEKASLQIDGD